jgi:hypothetical protein
MEYLVETRQRRRLWQQHHGIEVATMFISQASKSQLSTKIEDRQNLMNEFLLLALVIIYLVISYVPISGSPKPTWQSPPSEQSADGNSETNATDAHKSPFPSLTGVSSDIQKDTPYGFR